MAAEPPAPSSSPSSAGRAALDAGAVGSGAVGSGAPATGGADLDRRVLLLAATARDGEASRTVLAAAGIDCVLCDSLDSLCASVADGAAAVVLPEELVLADLSDRLARVLRQQPVWSDLPVIVLARTGVESPAVAKAMLTLGNVTVIERPVRITTFLSAVRVALRARQRQYQVRDQIAELERAERSLREARDAAQAANASKERFIAMLSHELRTPLTPVLMAVSALQGDPALPEPLREQLAMVRRNVELEARLIDDLLDISRITSGKLRLRVEPVDLHELLRHVVRICEPEARSRGVRVECRLEPVAAPGGGPAAGLRVQGDPARLQQVFWNLLKNALKFTPAGRRITLSARAQVAPGGGAGSEPARLAIVEVADEGAGIAPEALSRIFNAFEQGEERVARQSGGLGLGLAISKAIVDLHGGSIRADSPGPGAGATFTVTLPATAPASSTSSSPSPTSSAATTARPAGPGGNGHPRPAAASPDSSGAADSAADAAPGLPEPASPPSPAADERPRSVLLVEDHDDSARTLSRLLAGFGYDVATASCAAEALRLADARPFDVLISDIGLPDASGYDLMRQLAARHNIRGIALSGFGMEADVRRSREAGFADHLTKPIDLDQLDAALRRLTRGE